MPMSRLENIVERYCETFPDQLRRLAFLVSQACQCNILDETALDEAIQLCHRIGGTAHCMGYRYIGAVFLKLEPELDMIRHFDAREATEQLRVIEKRLSRLHEMAHYVEPENSILLRRDAEDDGSSIADDDLQLDWVLTDQRIMVADDDVSVRSLLHSTLKEAGVGDVKLTVSGKELLLNARSFAPTMIIADWMMSPVNGLELLQTIRGGNTSMDYDIPIIFISAMNQNKGIYKVIRNGADYFLLKPFSQNALVKCVTQIASRC